MLCVIPLQNGKMCCKIEKRITDSGRNNMKQKSLFFIFILLFCVLLISGCAFRTEGGKTPDGGNKVQEPTPTPEPSLPQYTVTYRLNGETLATELVTEGTCPAKVPALVEDRGVIAWNNTNGTQTDVWNARIAADTVFDAVLGPQLLRSGAYFAAENDGLFHPLNKFTRSDAVRAVYEILAVKPTGETFLKDVTTRARCWTAATTLVTQKYISLDEGGKFYPDVAITKADLADLLGKLFSPGAVSAALSELPEPLDRAQAAALINSLLEPTGAGDAPYYPDVAPDADYYDAVETAGISGDLPWAEDETAPKGFVNLEGYLYYVRDNGYFLCDGMVGTLYFDPTGRYTSGEEALDIYVAQIIENQIKKNMTREEMLRTVYVYVRDHYLYLRRNYYAIAETGWEIPEALTMFQTGKGNCYNFTAAFWALARGVGYDAVCYSGLVGVERDPHSWVEIEINGEQRIFDVETEMQYRLINDYITSMYNIDYERGALWSYVRTPEG